MNVKREEGGGAKERIFPPSIIFAHRATFPIRHFIVLLGLQERCPQCGRIPPGGR